MPSLKDLRTRIGSVKNTKKITATMKMVAAAKMRKAREAAEQARPYAERMETVLGNLAEGVNGGSAPLLLQGRPDVKNVRILVFGSDRGLCGGFNAHLLRALERHKHAFEAKNQSVDIVAMGNKAIGWMKARMPQAVVEKYPEVTKDLTFATADTIATQTVDAFERGQCDEVYVLYSKFVNTLTQKPTLVQLLPFTQQEADAAESGAASYAYEPSEEAILADLLPRNVSVQIYQSFLESAASEQSARMTAMDNATRNAGDMIKRLTLSYNRSRQAAITTELTEIISGAEAL